MSNTVIRRATPEDAPALAELGAVTFIEAFGQLYVPADLQAFLEESHSVEAYATGFYRINGQGEAARLADEAHVDGADVQAFQQLRAAGAWSVEVYEHGVDGIHAGSRHDADVQPCHLERTPRRRLGRPCGPACCRLA